MKKAEDEEVLTRLYEQYDRATGQAKIQIKKVIELFESRLKKNQRNKIRDIKRSKSIHKKDVFKLSYRAGQKSSSKAHGDIWIAA